MIFLGLVNITIVFLGYNHGRNAHVYLPVYCSWSTLQVAHMVL